jgi:hypothetical protein
MAANLRRGLRRVAVVVVVPWLIGWGTVYVANAHRIPQNPFLPDAEDYGTGSDIHVRAYLAARREERRAIEFGLGGPIVLGAVSALGFWVWLGFKPRA